MKTLAFLVILGLLTVLPAGVLAQQSEAPHRFFGTVLLADGSVAPDGTVVAAIVDGEVVATATVESSFQPGFYLLDVAPPAGESFSDPTVSFTIDGKAAAESAEWRTRESNELNLTVSPPDITAPVLTVPNDIVVAAETAEGTPKTNPEIDAFRKGATATDDRDPSPVVTDDAPELFPSGRDTVVTFTATDEAGNQSTGTATVTVQPFPLDKTAPVLKLPDDIVVDAETAEGTPKTNPEIEAFLKGATATDDRDPNPVVTHDAPDLFLSGSDTVVTFTATDQAGNQSTGTAKVTVQPFKLDKTAPVLKLPDDIVVDAETAEGTDITDPEIGAFLKGATATDDRDPDPVVTHDAPVRFQSGQDTLVTFTATDQAGNQSTGTATVTVQPFLPDKTAPVLTLPDDMVVDAETQEGTTITNPKIEAFLKGATATDDRDPNPVVTHARRNFSLPRAIPWSHLLPPTRPATRAPGRLR